MSETLYNKYVKNKRLSIAAAILLTLFEIGFGWKIEFVGTISVSEIFVVAYTLITIWWSRIIRIKEFRRVTLIYLLLLFFQIVSELAVGNSTGNALRGLAVTTVSYCHLYFVSKFLVKDRRYVVWLLLGLVLNSLIFGSPLEDDTVSILDDESAKYLKFYIAPLIINAALVVTYLFNKKVGAVIMMLIGLSFLVLGARSSGAMLILASFIVLVSTRHKLNIKWKYYVVPVLLLLYGGYCFYVNQVLKGNISMGNSEQLLNAANPYNPLDLLATGRPETFVGAMAFADAPLFGHGAWCSDAKYNYKYHMLVSTISNREYNTRTFKDDAIPAHSVIFGYAMQNGIAALVLITAIFIIFLRFGIKSFRLHDKFYLILATFTLEYLWNFVFSPVTHFRLQLPLFMGFFLAEYLYLKKRQQASSAGIKNFHSCSAGGDGATN